MKDKVFIITGATGIAAETIKIALQQKAKVFYISNEENSCVTLKEELKRSGFSADFMVGDLTRPETAVKLIKDCYETYGRIDGLFNVAGISGRKWGDGPMHECTGEGWEITLNTNVTTQFRMCREVLNRMLGQKRDEWGLRGTILNMSSILGIFPEPKHFAPIAYATAKGAILSMTRSMASFYAKEGIRVNAIAPGLTLTKMSEIASSNVDIQSFIKTKQPLKGTLMGAGEVSEAAVFLLGHQSRVITGQTLIVDAGWSVS